MNGQILNFKIVLITIGFLCACSEDGMVKKSSTFKVLAPMQSGNGSYSLKFTELEGLKDIGTLSGKYARFYMSPRVESGKLKGGAPRARFIQTTRGYVPANEITQQLVSVYAHLQRLAQIDAELGAGEVNKWPRDVGVAVKVKGGLDNNAFYDGATDSMLFVPYNQQGLPIAINAGILAHEHFHSLFYKLAAPDSSFSSLLDERSDFLNLTNIQDNDAIRERQTQNLQIGESVDIGSIKSLYKLVMIRSLNEGLADFWGWMYTGNPDFIAQSLPKEGRTRSLKVEDEKAINSLPNKFLVERSTTLLLGTGDSKKIKEYAVGYSYSLATHFSRFLKRFADIHARSNSLSDQNSRYEIGKAIIKSLPKIKEKFNILGDEYFTSEHFVLIIAEEVQDLKREECDFLVEVLNQSQGLTDLRYECRKGPHWRIEKQIEASSESLNPSDLRREAE